MRRGIVIILAMFLLLSCSKVESTAPVVTGQDTSHVPAVTGTIALTAFSITSYSDNQYSINVKRKHGAQFDTLVSVSNYASQFIYKKFAKGDTITFGFENNKDGGCRVSISAGSTQMIQQGAAARLRTTLVLK